MSTHRQQDSAVTGTSTIGDIGEFPLIERITRRRTAAATTLLGPGDDAAVVSAPDGRVVISTDMFVAGVHFRTDWVDGEDIGRRAALAAMADIAAMGAAPTALVVALSAPSDTPAALVTRIGAGLGEAAAAWGAEVVGGDLTGGTTLAITVTVLGDLRGARPVLRSGARVGQVVALAGRIGHAAAGLDVLTRGFRSPAAAVDAYRSPAPPLGAGPLAAGAGATAMIDISDGLLADAGHIAAASGVCIDIDSAALAVPDRLVEVASALGKDPMVWMLTGGEDHALLATFPPEAMRPEPWTVIGRVTGPAPEPVMDDPQRGVPSRDPGAGLVTVDGQPYVEVASGWQHFR